MMTQAKRVRMIRMLCRKYLAILLGAILASLGLELFLIPNHVIDGGVVGISIMADAMTGLGFGTFLVLLNLPFLVLGWKQIGRRFAFAVVIAVLLLSLFSSLFEGIPRVTEDPFLAAIFGGIIDGLGCGLIIRNGASLDGTEILSIILDKKSVFSVGEFLLFINIFILSGAGFLFGWDRAMYSLVAYFVIAKMIDVVIKGLSQSYAVTIVTDHDIEIKEALGEQLHAGVTLLHGAGGYTGEAKEILYTVVTRLEIENLKELVTDIDENAFIAINSIHEIVGGRFRHKHR